MNNSINKNQEMPKMNPQLENGDGSNLETLPDKIENTEQEKTPEEILSGIDEQVKLDEIKIGDLTASVEKTKAELNSVRESLGIPSSEEDPHSILAGKDQIEKLEKEKEDLEKQKEVLITKEEKEKLIQAEKEKIIQEKIDKLFEEFKNLKPEDFQAKLSDTMNKENAKALTQAFNDGLKQLPDLIKKIPEVLKEFDKELTKEATERVEKKIKEGQQKIQESKAEELMTPEQQKMSQDMEAEAMMTPEQKLMSEERAQETK